MIQALFQSGEFPLPKGYRHFLCKHDLMSGFSSRWASIVSGCATLAVVSGFLFWAQWGFCSCSLQSHIEKGLLIFRKDRKHLTFETSPKWMVLQRKTLLKLNDLGGKPTILGNIQMLMYFALCTSRTQMFLDVAEARMLRRFSEEYLQVCHGPFLAGLRV